MNAASAAKTNARACPGVLLCARGFRRLRCLTRFTRLPTLRTRLPVATDHVFFYGTLMAGFDRRRRAGIENKMKFRGRGHISGALFDLGIYPAAVPSNDGRVWGEVYGYDDEATVLTALDDIEGYTHDDPDRSLYTRKKTSVALDERRDRRCVGVLLQRAARRGAAHPVGRLPRAHQGPLTPGAHSADQRDEGVRAMSVPTYANFINGEWVPSASGETFENRNPANTDDLIGHFQKSVAGGRGPRGRRGRRAGLRDVATRACPGRAEILYRAAQLFAERKDSLRARHDPRDGQGAGRDGRRRPGSHRHGAADGRRGPSPARPDHAVGAAQQVRDVGAAADRRLRNDHRLELPDGRAVLEDPAGARLRQHRRLQAGGGSAALGRQLRSDAR